MESVEKTGSENTKVAMGAASGVRHELAVLAADLVGYSELVFRDPHGGVKILRDTRAIVVNAIRSRDGKVLATPGDFVLATFNDIESGIGAAVIAQQELYERNRSSRSDTAGHWKIGIEFGEVFAFDDDYYGTAINVAARLQALAGPGEIFLTSRVRKQANLPNQVLVQDIGLKRLKNIDKPVHIYRAYLPAYEGLFVTLRYGYRTAPKHLRQLRKPILKLESFRTLGKSSKSSLFSVALVDEVHLILSRIANSISVIAPAQLANGTHDYVLSGTIQSGGPHLRIMTRLVSCSDGLTLWAERYECDLRRPFDIQDQIAREIVSALQLALTEGEQAQLWRRGTVSGEAWEQFQRGHDFERRYTRQDHRSAIEHYRKALNLDPNYLSAMVSFAFCRLDEIRLGWTSDRSGALGEAEELCHRAMNLKAQHPDVQALLAFIRYFQGRHDESTEAMDTAVRLASQSPEIIGYQGALHDLMGDYSGAIRAYTRAFSLSIHSPAWIASNLGLSYLALGEDDEAERIYREVVQQHPNYVRAWIGLAVALTRQGKSGEAAHAAESVLSLDPHFTAQEWAQSRPFNDQVLVDHFVKDLRATGLP